MIDNNTRTFPRSLSDAFPDERAHCIEGPDRHARADKAVYVTLALGFVFVLALLAWEQWV